MWKKYTRLLKGARKKEEINKVEIRPTEFISCEFEYSCP